MMIWKKKIVLIAFAISLLMSCQTVPVTGRQQVHLIPDSQINAMSFDAYDDFLSKHKVIVNTDEARQVSRVGKNIKEAVGRYFREKGLSYRLEGYDWEFNLIDEETVNAWCMPGGKVVVYKGILSVADGDEGLAVVLGHEIAHAVANHGNERMSQGLLVQMGGAALSVALSQKPQETQELFMAAFGLGAQVGVLLPYSRLHESEADHLGLIFMAMAGYDPRVAVEFWQRMSLSNQGESPPELISTHPADSTRINNIKKLLPEAMKYYKKAQ